MTNDVDNTKHQALLIAANGHQSILSEVSGILFTRLALKSDNNHKTTQTTNN